MGSRYDYKPCILMIDAKKAWNEGIKFYLGNEKNLNEKGGDLILSLGKLAKNTFCNSISIKTAIDPNGSIAVLFNIKVYLLISGNLCWK